MNGSSAQNNPSNLSMHPLVAVVQFTASVDKSRNLEICSLLIRKAQKRGAEMIFLPEGFDYICGSFVQSVELAETLDGPLISAYQQIASELQVWLSLGGFHLKAGKEDRIHNSHILIDADGKIVDMYNKTHLFVVDIPGKLTLDESLYCIPGGHILPPVATPVGKIGLLCCYDLRFPEISGILRQKGAEILTYPAAFAVATGIAHWEPLLRARAIENQCYVIAAAQTGSHNNLRQSFGHAMIVDPWGRIIAQVGDGDGVAVAEIDLDRLQSIRSSMPVQSHRRRDLYRLSLGPIRILLPSKEFYDFGGFRIHKNSVFYETDLSIAFVNLKPVIPGHCLVIPKRGCRGFRELQPQEVTDLFHVVQIIQEILETRYSAKSFTISVQDGEDAGQTVKHVHVHVLPRIPGDFQGDEVYRELESHDKDEKREARDQDQMSAEAAEYRRLTPSCTFLQNAD